MSMSRIGCSTFSRSTRKSWIAILEAATQDPGPSPVADALAAILSSLREQESLLQDLPQTLAATIRDELQRDREEETPNGRSDEPDRIR